MRPRSREDFHSAGQVDVVGPEEAEWPEWPRLEPRLADRREGRVRGGSVEGDRLWPREAPRWRDEGAWVAGARAPARGRGLRAWRSGRALCLAT